MLSSDLYRVSTSPRKQMELRLDFKRYLPPFDGVVPPGDVVAWGEWPTVGVRPEYLGWLSERAGFGPDAHSVRGVLLQDWTSNAGMCHPRNALVVASRQDLQDL